MIFTTHITDNIFMTMTATATTTMHRIIMFMNDEPCGDGAGTTTRAVSLPC